LDESSLQISDLSMPTVLAPPARSLVSRQP
jgi:hypothetical protein